jgi:tetratricopeptide (TPR) repeat protein
MKFKAIYLYGVLALVAVAILIIVGTQDSSNPGQLPVTNNQTMPDDDVHKQLMNQGSSTPGKENVSEEYKQKLAALKEAVDKNPADTLAMREYADFLLASHKMNEAITYYEKILDVNPKRADVRFALAVIYFNMQDYQKCEDENDKILTFDPKNQMALYNIGAIAATRGNKEKAKEYWNKVISINEKSETGQLAKESLTKL